MYDKVKVTVLYPDGSLEVPVGIPRSWTVKRFISEFIRKANLSLDYDYEAELLRTNAFLNPLQKIEDVFQEGDKIRIRYQAVGGGGPSEESLDLYSYTDMIKHDIKSRLSKDISLPDNVREQLIDLAEKENTYSQRKLVIYYLFIIYSILIVCTLIIIFLQGFHIYGFDIDKETLKWLGVSVLGEVAGLAALVYGSLFKVEDKHTT